ncbi:hypothetical protein CORC01_13084 [Colletotrichum orchidophilum]|uniref:Protein kinase domain-containing protein n=1 Tax=Colletotrichum orchidophilum TaxID=1209926 RepID=A0A1G4AR04_9PEZI|nr:uncharacterized protein CORC01_13084 [Colletotrichum orchidophilum]OHE91607.1 hypothetical protein CORC01_13084 [Colletotrichum orchidophilum]
MDNLVEHPNHFDNPAGAQPAPTRSTIIAKTYHSIIESSTWNGSPAAIKKFNFPANPRASQRWRKEIEALNLARGHPNITQILHSDSQTLTITLRQEPGRSLDKHINTTTSFSTLSAQEAAAVWSQISSALAHLHAKCNIIHDDVKPDNIVFFSTAAAAAAAATTLPPHTEPAPHAVLIDFGAAITSPYALPLNGWTPSGTPPYAPPEFVDRCKSYAGDVWGLGITLLFCFGYIPLPAGDWILPHVFEDERVKGEMVAWLDGIEELRTSPRISGDSDRRLLGWMLDPDPEARIGSVELARLLNS